MGVICNCNIGLIPNHKKEVSIDININKPIEDETNEFTKLKLYFQSNEDNKLSTQRSKKETLYDLIIRRLLEQNEPKKNHPKRKITIRNPKKIIDMVKEIVEEYEEFVSFPEKNDNIEESVKDNLTISSTKITARLDFPNMSKKITDKEYEYIINKLFDNKIINEKENYLKNNELKNLFLKHFFDSNKYLYKKGEEKQFLILIESGTVKYMIDDIEDNFSQGDCFSTEILEKNSKIDCFAKTISKTKLFSIIINEEIQHHFNSFDFISKNKDEKIKILLQIPLFSNLEISKLDKIANKMIKLSLGKYSKFEFKLDEYCYFLVKGCVNCLRENKIVKKINPLTTIGEIGLFLNKKLNLYSYDIISKSILYQLSFKDVKKIIGDKYMIELINKLYISTIKRSEMFNRLLSIQNFSKLFDLFKLMYYNNNTVVPDKEKKVILVLSGRLILKETKSVVANSGDLFISLLIKNKYEQSTEILSEYESLIFECNWKIIINTLQISFGENKEKINFYNMMKILRTCKLFENLNEWKIFQLADSVNLKTFNDNKKIIKNGPLSDKLYIIKEGKVKSIMGDFVQDLKKGDWFGDITSNEELIAPNKIQVFVSNGKSECYYIEKEIYDQIIHYKDKTLIDKAFEVIKGINSSFNLDDLFFVRELDNSKVCLVHDKKNIYAAKTIIIKNARQQKLLKYYIEEKNILLSLNHPFISKLINTFKTNYHLYFILEFINGLTISSYCRLRPKDYIRNIKEMVFIGSCLFSIVNYLHSMRVIHRNIKPSNCIINLEGYIILIDFGIAKDITGKDFTKTILGTNHYISPEMIEGKGYSFATDYWSIGVLLYKFFFGYLPFGKGSNEQIKIYEEIKNSKLMLPSDVKHSNIDIFFHGILCKNPDKRVHSLNDVKKFDLFKNINFDDLVKKRLSSPFKLDIKNVEVDFNNVSLPLKTYLENELLMHGESNLFSSSKSNELMKDF